MSSHPTLSLLIPKGLANMTWSVKNMEKKSIPMSAIGILFFVLAMTLLYWETECEARQGTKLDCATELDQMKLAGLVFLIMSSIMLAFAALFKLSLF
jgi:hypothetical protein